MARRTTRAKFTPSRRGKTFLDPVIEQLGRDAKTFAARQMKALGDMEAARKQVEGYLRPSDRGR